MRRNEQNTLPSLMQRNEQHNSTFAFPNSIAPIKSPTAQNGSSSLGKRPRPDDPFLSSTRREELPSIQPVQKISRISKPEPDSNSNNQDAKLSSPKIETRSAGNDNSPAQHNEPTSNISSPVESKLKNSSSGSSSDNVDNDVSGDIPT